MPNTPLRKTFRAKLAGTPNTTRFGVQAARQLCRTRAVSERARDRTHLAPRHLSVSRLRAYTQVSTERDAESNVLLLKIARTTLSS